jgi:hypothetical protein
MKRRLNKIYLISLAVILTITLYFLPTTVFATEYTFTTIDVPGADRTVVNGINDSGSIVGTYYDATGYHGFLYSGGAFTTINFLNATYANGINNSGDIVGYGTGPWYHNFLYSGDAFTTIDIGDTSWGANGINDSGGIVGAYGDATGRHGFLYVGGRFTTIDVPGAVDWTVPKGINNSGAIVGIYNYIDAPSTHRGFHYSEGIFTPIDVPGAFNGTDVFGINDFGDIVGEYYDDSYHNFLYSGGAFATIVVPGASLTSAYSNAIYGINNSGQIVGYYVDDNSIMHGFVATPIRKSVSIDIKPGSEPNSINLKSKGVVPVAILTTEDFDASTVDPTTVRFADAPPVKRTMEDVDFDGDLDMLLHFSTQELNLDANSIESTLTGMTDDEIEIVGKDSVNIVPKGKGKK